MNTNGCWRGIGVSVLCLVAASLLGACAEVLLVSNAATLVAALPSQQPRWVETNRLTLDATEANVYSVLEKEVEKNDRRIIERNPAERTLLVSYPFSWLKNNWGGTVKISCVADQYGTTVIILGDGRDVVPHVRAIGNEILSDLADALRREPRSL